MSQNVQHHERSRFDLQCPKDSDRMQKLQVGGVTVDRCASCFGIWLDASELGRIRQIDGAAAALDTREKVTEPPTFEITPRRCPRDGTVMNTARDAEQKHIEREVCPTCGGMFLDAGELRDLAEFTFAERLKAMVR